MKKIFNILVILFLLFLSIDKSQAMTFEEAYNQTSKTPMVVLIYADWAVGYENILAQYKKIQPQFAGVYNFTELNIASQDAKFFNSKFHIYPNLPYVLMFRDNGKVSRYIQRSCAADSACISSKLKSFIQ